MDELTYGEPEANLYLGRLEVHLAADAPDPEARAAIERSQALSAAGRSESAEAELARALARSPTGPLAPLIRVLLTEHRMAAEDWVAAIRWASPVVGDPVLGSYAGHEEAWCWLVLDARALGFAEIARARGATRDDPFLAPLPAQRIAAEVRRACQESGDPGPACVDPLLAVLADEQRAGPLWFATR